MPNSATSYRLLVVDDEQMALNLARRVFETESDIDLQATTSGSEGLELAKAHDIDLFITDQRMPEMTGLDFLAKVREIRPRALRILLTAFPDTSVAVQAINEGLVYRFVLKPWEPDDMRVTVRRALETKRLADENDRLITQLKTSHEQLVQSEHLAAIGRVSSGISHELGNAVGPLMVSANALAASVGRLLEAVRAANKAVRSKFAAPDVERLNNDLLRAVPDTLGSAEQAIGVIRAKAAQLDTLVRGLNSYTVGAVLQPFDLNQAVLSAIQLLSHRFRGITLLERDLNAVPQVRGRQSEITQVVLNLLTNAADAVESSRNAKVGVRTWRDGQTARLEVADNGKGLDPAVAERLFQPFTSTKEPGRASGLGLSVCRSIVENHGGRIEVTSAPDQGTRFTVTLPAAGAAP